MRESFESMHVTSMREEGGENPAAMVERIFRGMCVTVALAIPLSAILAPWRVTTGLLLGGLLSLLSYHWLRTSIGAIFGATAPGARPTFTMARSILRHVVVAGVVALAYWLDLVSLAATLVGLCSFVVAALVEGFMQLYFAVIRREEI